MTMLKRVLVVEDNALLLLDLIDGLADFGIEAVPATSADAALPLLLRGDLDAVITDIEMPGTLDGLHLARLAAELRSQLPIAVVSGGVRPTRQDLPAGATFFAKPYALDAVLAALCPQQHLCAA